MDKLLIGNIGEAIFEAQKYLVVTHIRPDGDALGSLIGLGLMLGQRGKPVQMVCLDGIPANYRFLTGADLVAKKVGGEPGLILTVDCSELGRIGSGLQGLPQPDINIDHHQTNLNFARLNLVEPAAVSTTEILARCLDIWGYSIQPEIAAAFLTGMITDTLGFRTANVTPDTLRMAACFMEAGANLADIYLRTLVQRSYPAAKLWGSGLSKLEREGPLIWTSLTMADRRLVGYPGKDDADLINILSTIDEADVYIIFVEQPHGSVKVSWRARPGLDISRVALRFGGGGHPAASGAEIIGDLVDIQQQVLEATRQILVN
jgi:phosphoesterase RecJ-like protein